MTHTHTNAFTWKLILNSDLHKPYHIFNRIDSDLMNMGFSLHVLISVCLHWLNSPYRQCCGGFFSGGLNWSAQKVAKIDPFQAIAIGLSHTVQMFHLHSIQCHFLFTKKADYFKSIVQSLRRSTEWRWLRITMSIGNRSEINTHPIVESLNHLSHRNIICYFIDDQRKQYVENLTKCWHMCENGTY